MRNRDCLYFRRNYVVGFYGFSASVFLFIFGKRKREANRKKILAVFLDGLDYVFRANDVAKRERGFGKSKVGAISRRASQGDYPYSAVLYAHPISRF